MPDYLNRLLLYPRGSVWKVQLIETEKSETGVQTGYRPALIISNDMGNYTSDSVMVALITSNKNRTKWGINVGFENELGECNVVLCNQIQTINKNRLVKFMGVMPVQVMNQIETAIRKAMFIQDYSLDISQLEKTVDRIIEAKTSELQDSQVILTQQGVNDIANKLEQLFEDVLIPFDRSIKQRDLEKIRESAPIASALVQADKILEQNTEIGQDDGQTEIEIKHYDQRKSKGFWTKEHKLELLDDNKALSQEEVLSKWGISNKRTLYQMVYKFKKDLQYE